MRKTPDLEKGIYVVTHFLLQNGKRFLVESDMIVIDGRPYAVLEWGGPPENQYPALKIELDWTKLHSPTQDGYVVYDGDVIDARPVQ